MKETLTTIGVIVAVILSGLAISGSSDQGPQGQKGDKGNKGDVVVGGAGPTKTNQHYFYEGFTVGHDATASSTDDSATAASSALLDCKKPFVSYTANLNTTITTQASTTAPFSTMRAGESCSVLFYSATTTAATTITFAEGTGVDLQYAEGTGGDAVLNGLDIAKLTFVKKADKDVIVIFEEYTEAQ